MDAREILRSRKKEIVERWVDAVFSTYPLETKGFLRTRKDRFTNPVAHMTARAADALFEAVCGEDVDPEEIKKGVDQFVRLRAVQKFSPGPNMAVFYLLKPILRELALPDLLAANQLEEYLEMESRLDTLVLLAFDIYMDARETLAESRIREIRNQHAQLAKWAAKLEGPEQE